MSGGKEESVASGYGEDDTEAAAMTDVAQHGPRRDPDAGAQVPPEGTAIPAAGTTETDVAANLREKAERESNG